jgi:hypothetical protein
MKAQLAQKRLMVSRFLLALLSGALLCMLTGFAPRPQSSGDDASTALCTVVVIPLWILSIWYWRRHYKIRGKDTTLPVLFAVFFSGLAILAMAIDAPLRALFSKQELGPCPKCGKTKLIRENPSQDAHVKQPQCPHCKAMVGPGTAVEATAPASVSSRIEELQDLLRKNLISQEEFDKKRTELLNRV